MGIIEILTECKQALINRDAVLCYNSGHNQCKCTLCKIDILINKLNKYENRNTTRINYHS